MAELNIVDLIENNPVTKLTNTYNVKMLNKIKQQFTNTEQQLFISSFYCYLNYDKTKDYVIDMDNIWRWLGFSTKQHATRTLEKNFNNNVDYKESSLTNIGRPHIEEENKHQKGGHNIKKYMLNIRCFKSFCLKAQTKKAWEIHDYYIKLEEILQEVIEEEGTELKEKLEEEKRKMELCQIELKEKESEIEQKDNALKLRPEIEKHKMLLREYETTDEAIIYILKIKMLDNGNYIIKIGQSRKGIKGRYDEASKNHGKENVFIIDVFIVRRSDDFEKYLHTHKTIRPYRVTDLKGHESEKELFLINKNLTYFSIINLIKNNIKQFDFSYTDYERLELENEKMRIENVMLKSNRPYTEQLDEKMIMELIETNRHIINNVYQHDKILLDLQESNKEILSRLNSMQTKTTTKLGLPDPHVGPRIQKINPENLQEIIKVYETATEAIKENPKLKRPSLMKAILLNTIYCGYRWLSVDRDFDASIIHHIEPTKETKVQNLGYIAKLNSEKTKILTVYIDRKTASQLNGYESVASLDNPVRNGTLTKNHYYMLYDKCEEDLKDEFCKKLPDNKFLLYRDGIGRFDMEGTLLEEFTSKYDCVASGAIGQKLLDKSLDKELSYNGMYFRYIPSKLYV
jgi:hypothetical protein